MARSMTAYFYGLYPFGSKGCLRCGHKTRQESRAARPNMDRPLFDGESLKLN